MVSFFRPLVAGNKFACKKNTMNFPGSSDLTLQWCDKNFSDLSHEQTKLMQELKDCDEADTKRSKGIMRQLAIIQAMSLSICKLRALRKAAADAS